MNAQDLILAESIKRNDYEGVKNALEAGVVINKHFGTLENTFLHLVTVERGFLGIVKLLVENGIDTEAVDITGDSFLSRIAMNDMHDRRNGYEASQLNDEIVECLKFLIAKGIDVNRKYARGETLLHRWIVDLKNYRLAEILLENGADVNSTDIIGRTPLHEAAKENYMSSILLLKSGANPNIQTLKGRTPLHEAAKHMNEFTVLLLLEHGARNDIVDYDGKKPSKMSFLGGINDKIKNWDKTKKELLKGVV